METIEPPHDKPNKMACAPSEDSDQPGHPPSLIRVSSVRSMGSWGPKLSSCGQRRCWSDWMDAQADLSLRWAHMPFCWFCHVAAQLLQMSCRVGAWKKPTKWPVYPAKTRTNLDICSVWSESWLSSWRRFGSLATRKAHSKDWSDWADVQIALSIRWVHRSFCGFLHASAQIWQKDGFFECMETIVDLIVQCWSKNCSGVNYVKFRLSLLLR